MSDSVQFQFSKQRLTLLAVCFCLICLLLFGAGLATGLFLGGGTTKPELLKRSALRPVAPPAAHPKAQSAAGAPSHSSNTFAASAAVPGPALSLVLSGLPQRGQAERMAELLKREGFGHTEMSSYQQNGQTWYQVSLGPYARWEDAARAAGELRRTFNLQPSILPSRVHS